MSESKSSMLSSNDSLEPERGAKVCKTVTTEGGNDKHVSVLMTGEQTVDRSLLMLLQVNDGFKHLVRKLDTRSNTCQL